MLLDYECTAFSTNTKIRVRPNRKWKLAGNTNAYCVCTVYNYTCGVSALWSTGCLQIQPKKDEMVCKLSIFVVNK